MGSLETTPEISNYVHTCILHQRNVQKELVLTKQNFPVSFFLETNDRLPFILFLNFCQLCRMTLKQTNVQNVYVLYGYIFEAESVTLRHIEL